MRKILTGTVLAAALMLTVNVAQAGKPGGGGGKPGGQSAGQSKNSGQGKPSGQTMHSGQSKNSGQQFKQGGKSSHSSQANHFFSSKGTKFSHGYFYSDRFCNHWSYQCYWPRYGCNCYYCPHATCWYYWCEPRCCYLPVSCVEYAAPVAAPVAATAEVVNVFNSPGAVVSQSQGLPSDLPPVLPGGPSGAGPVQPFKAGGIK